MRRELPHNRLEFLLDLEPLAGPEAQKSRIPCIFPASREFWASGDEFAHDCLLQRGVHCKLARHGFVSPPGHGHLCVEPGLEAHGLCEPRRLWRMSLAEVRAEGWWFEIRESSQPNSRH